MNEVISEMFALGIDITAAGTIIASIVSIIVMSGTLVTQISDAQETANKISYISEYSPFLGKECTVTDFIFTTRYYDNPNTNIKVYLVNTSGTMYEATYSESSGVATITLRNISNNAKTNYSTDTLYTTYKGFTTAIVENNLATGSIHTTYQGGVIVGIVFRAKP